MSSNLQTLVEVFEGKVIRIPAFQRGYSWGESELEDLWRDLENLLYGEEGRNHFTGVIVFEKINEISGKWKKEFKAIELTEKELVAHALVDGQQRMTTLMILLFVLMHEMKDHEISRSKTIFNKKNDLLDTFFNKAFSKGKKPMFGYEVDTPSHEFLLSTIFEDFSIDVSEPETIYTKNLQFAKDFFKGKFREEKFVEKTKRKLLEAVCNQLKFNELILYPEDIDISMVFETLNFRGKPLSHLELLKNRLLFLVERSTDFSDKRASTKDQIVNTWLTIYEYLGKTESLWINEDEFLKSFWIIYFDHSNKVKDDFNRFVNDLFQIQFPIAKVSNPNIQPKEITKFLKALKKAIRAMYYIHNPLSISVEVAEETEPVFGILRTPNVSDLLFKLNELRSGWNATKNLVCSYIISSKYDPSEFLEMLICIERHNFLVFNIFGQKSDTSKNQLYRMASSSFRVASHKANYYEINECVSKGNQKMEPSGNGSRIRDKSNIERFTDFVHNSRTKNQHFFDWSGADYMLKEYERLLRCEGGEIAPYIRFPYLKKSVLIDNVLKLEGVSHDKKNNYGYSLGNLTLKRTKETVVLNLKEVPVTIIMDARVIPDALSGMDLFHRGVKLVKFIENRWGIRLVTKEYTDTEVFKLIFGFIPSSLRSEFLSGVDDTVIIVSE